MMTRAPTARILRTTAAFLVTCCCLIAGGCNTFGDVAKARGSGLTQTYDAPYSVVWPLIPRAANAVDLSVAGVNEEERYVLAEHGMSAFSWGEKVAIFASPVPPSQTEVEVVSKATVATNITATNWERKLLQALADLVSAKHAP